MNINLCSTERPYTFDQMVGQEAVVNNIRQQAKSKKFFQCYILEGQFGSGKTTMARILSRAINCDHPDEHGNPCGCCASCRAVGSGSQDVIELDAASNTGVDSIREIKDSVDFLPIELNKKVYIIDEVHKLSDSAFNALLKVLEEPPEHVVFILCTTEMKKIPATIRSRAACYHFAQIKQSDITQHLTALAEKYQFHYTPEGVELIAMNASGSMRNALKLLEQTAQSDLGVTEENVRQMLGLTDPTDLFAIMDALVQGNIVGAVRFIRKLLAGGANPLSMVSDLLDISADAVVRSSTNEALDRNTERYREMLYGICEDVSADVFCCITNGLLSIYQKLQQNADESTLICGLIAMSETKDGMILRLTDRVRVLEDKLSDLMSGEYVLPQSKMKSDASVQNDVSDDSMDHLITETLRKEAESFQAPEDKKKEVFANVMTNLNMTEKKETFLTTEESNITEEVADTAASHAMEEAVSDDAKAKKDGFLTEKPEDNKEEARTVEPQEVDPFLFLGMFGYSSAKSVASAVPVSDKKPETKTAASVLPKEEEVKQNEIPSDSPSNTAASTSFKAEKVPQQNTVDPQQVENSGEELDTAGLYLLGTNMRDGFTAAGSDVPFASERTETQTVGGNPVEDVVSTGQDISAEYVPAKTDESVDVFLPQFYQAHPFMESVLELGFTRSEEGGKTEYTTDMGPMFRIAKTYGEIFDFPFAIRFATRKGA